jgi:sigma-E factor negative regulatory protein RseA
MNERMNESLSALMDGETDELEVRRLLNQLEQDDELRGTWQRYQMIGSLMRGEPAAAVDLSRGIMQALDGEPMDEVSRPQVVAASSHRFRWLASTAVAASVTLAVLVGVRMNTADPVALVAEQQTQAPAPVQLASAPVQALSEADAAQLEAAQRKLQEYVLQHTEQATMTGSRAAIPFARVVDFQQPAEGSK